MEQMRCFFGLLIFTAFFAVHAYGQEEELPIYEALKSGELVPGAYQTYKEFFYNFPARRDSIFVEFELRDEPAWEGTFEVEPRYAKNDNKVKKVWGFSTGKQAFIFHQIDYFPIEMDDKGNLFFYGYQIIDYSGAGAAGVMGGAIGGAIHQASVETKAKRTKVKYTIDPKTGQVVHPLLGTSQSLASAERDIVIYRSKKREKEEEVRFLLNGKYVYAFVPASYLIMPYGPEVQETVICVGEKYERCITAKLPEEGTLWFKVSLGETDEELVLEQVEEDLGWFEYSKAANKQDKRGDQQPIEVLD